MAIGVEGFSLSLADRGKRRISTMTQSRTNNAVTPSNPDIDPDSRARMDQVQRDDPRCVDYGAGIDVYRAERLRAGEIALKIITEALLLAIFVSATASSMQGLSMSSSIYSSTVGYGTSLSMYGTCLRP
jgi:hypothetical protein